MNDSLPPFGLEPTSGDDDYTQRELMERVGLTICGTTFWHLDRPGVASVLETGVILEGATTFLWYTQISPYTSDKRMLWCKDPSRLRPYLLTRLPYFNQMSRVELVAVMLVLVRERVDPFRLFSRRNDNDHGREADELKWFEVERLSRRWENLVPEVEAALSASKLLVSKPR